MYKAKTFGHFQELVDYMNGVVIGKKLPKKVFGLHGLTFIVNDGADKTTTFQDPTFEGLSPKQIYAQIYAVQNDLAVLRDYGDSPVSPSLAVIKDTYTVKGTGTANAILGFDNVDVQVNDILPANIIATFRNEGNRYHLIHV
jgi:hypothetical protein